MPWSAGEPFVVEDADLTEIAPLVDDAVVVGSSRAVLGEAAVLGTPGGFADFVKP
ncbi:hypothetical protein [Rhodococcus sp. ARC_M6]|uniref:hypothetical protein n=1 Tax=Rhodococcus sp. ARC_M6 TaxID=2928852 RepID=UPI001FB1AABF|nr:hypothetical protein [Rhodococcus sp. ARC_M6]MCJ0907042.1 hypothetical protein [Rhodococcus sp. ARC_M6]